MFARLRLEVCSQVVIMCRSVEVAYMDEYDNGLLFGCGNKSSSLLFGFMNSSYKCNTE
jgi:hypothetical protein